jgi:drug/metabolite transporter (DMT)-like permease
MNTAEYKAHILMILASLIIAGSFLASEKLAGVANSLSLTLLRFVGASIILAPVVLYKNKWRIKIISTMPRALIISLFYSSFFIGFFEALKTTTPLNTGAILTLVPLITSMLTIIVLKDRVSRKQLAIYMTGIVTTTWVVFNGDLDMLLSFELNKGDLIFLGATILYCCFPISMKLLYRNDEMIVMVFCILLGGVFWMLSAKLFLAYPLDWHMVQGTFMLHMLYLVVAATLGTVYLFQRTTIVLGPSRVSAYIFLNPALVALLLFIIDGVVIPTRVIPAILISSIATLLLQNDTSQEIKNRNPIVFNSKDN